MVSAASEGRGAAERREHLGTLPRRLGIGASAALIVGFIIGSGIFRSPSRVALEAGSARVALLAETIDAKGVFNILRSWYNNRAGRDDPRAIDKSSTARR
ncbi:MAG TPA: hypothetical protein VKB88_11365 [Bryobacteraceae bacterium]|nr:hypothetical protein [Bryobacteraceae bacterium]